MQRIDQRGVDLQPPAALDGAEPLVALAAARLGSTRLIDNLEIEPWAATR